MNKNKVKDVKTKEDARRLAIAYQTWISQFSPSLDLIIFWQGEFQELGERFNLLEEFKENGII